MVFPNPEPSDRERSIPDWKNIFDRFEQAISSGDDALRVRLIMRLARLTNQVPEDILSDAIPILQQFLRSLNDSRRTVQEAAVYCLYRIACCGEEGSFASDMGRYGIPAALIRFLFYSEANSFRKVTIKCLWSLVTFGYPIRTAVARLGGLDLVINQLNSFGNDSSRRYLLEILSALTTIRECRRILVSVEGMKFLVEAASTGSLVSRERACQAIGLIGVTRRSRRMLVETGVIPVLVDLFRSGDDATKLLAANTLGIVSAHIEHIRAVTESGVIPLYADLLTGPNPLGKEIAEDVFCILAVAETNAVLIVDHLVRILREGEEEAKVDASEVFWDLARYKHSVSVVRNSGAFPLLVEVLRNGTLEYKERVSATIAQISYHCRDREPLFEAGVIRILIDWLGDESEELRDNAAEALINFSEDQEYCNSVREAVDHPVFQSMQSRLMRINSSESSDELMIRSMRRVSIRHFTQDPDLL